MPKSKNRRSKKNSPSALKKLALLSVPLALLGGGGALAINYIGQEKIDAQYCFDRNDRPVHAFFIDNSLTRNLSRQQSRDFERGFENAYANAEPNTRFYVFSTASDVEGSIAKPVATICKPAANISEHETLNVPSKTAAYLKQQADTAKLDFDAIVTSVLTDASDASKAAKDSPIFEQLQAISRFEGFQVQTRSLTVLTDGIQNSETAKFCQIKDDLPPFAVFKGQSRYRYVAPDSFEDLSVNFLLVENGKLPHPHLPYCTNNEIRAFWPDYFKGNGAKQVTLTRLRYGAE